MTAWIPLVPPSMNSLLYVIWHQKRMETKPEVRMFRSQFKQYLPVWQPQPGALYDITFQFHQDWYYGNGQVKRQDAPNLIKCCLDAVCERYGMDDARIWHLSCAKVQAKETPGVQVRMVLCASS